MAGRRFHGLFATPIGTCGLAWDDEAVLGCQLPAASEAAALARLARHHGSVESEAMPAFVAAAVARIRALMAGAGDTLADVPLEMTAVPAFNRAVYAVTRAIPPGRTLTYGEVAARIGERGAARAVGRALGQNPFPILVPCHRVLGAGESLGGFSAPGGRATKLRLLALEGLDLTGGPGLFEHAGLPL